MSARPDTHGLVLCDATRPAITLAAIWTPRKGLGFLNREMSVFSVMTVRPPNGKPGVRKMILKKVWPDATYSKPCSSNRISERGAAEFLL